MDPRLVVLIFSRNRALQLDATLRSLLLHVEDVASAEVCILYAASGERHERQYDQLAEQYAGYPSVRFIRERDFRGDLLALLSPFDYVLFSVDDNLFVRDFSLRRITDALARHPDALGYSLRLGHNTTYCYALNAAQVVPPLHEVGADLYQYRWTDSEYDFGYPLEVSSSVYRVSDLFPALAEIPFANPNTLEARLDRAKSLFARSKPFLLCSETSQAFCIPLNKVQSVAPANRVAQAEGLDADSLAGHFDAGLRIDVRALSGFVPDACHQEVDLDLIEGAEPRVPADSPTVSVVIPCYNQAHFLEMAVASVVAQTCTDWECIIVDDGSTDATAAVAGALQERYAAHRIHVIRQQNGGPAAARNAGIAAAGGRYILPLDADDLLHPQMLEKTVAILDADPSISIVYTNRADFGAVERIIRAQDYDFAAICHANRLSYCSLYRKEAWIDAGGYNPNMIWGYEDWDFWISCGDKGHHARLLPEPLFRYRVNDEGMNALSLRHDAELKARIVLNHPHLYTSEERAWAEELWASATDAQRPFFSVVIPTHNRPDFLPSAVRSVLGQTFDDFEIIIVNDAGSPVDGVVEAFADSRIRLIEHDRNQGLAAARNTGIRAARGRFIALLDDDDIFYPHHLATAKRHLSDDAPVVYTDAVRATYIREGNRYQLVEKRVPYSIDYDRTMLLVGNIAPVNCFVFSRTLALEVGLFDPTLEVLEDWDFWLRLSKNADLEHVTERTVQVNWRKDGTSLTHEKSAAFGACRQRIEAKHRDEIDRLPDREGIMNRFRRIWSKDGQIQEPLVSILILTHNALDYTKQCIASLQKHTHLPHEIIFVDNASTDGTTAYLEELAATHAHYRLIRNQTNVGFAEGNNQALAAARGAYMLLLNNDTVVTEGWLERLVTCAESDPRIGIVGPMTNSTSGPQALPEVGYDVRSLDALETFARLHARQYGGKRYSFWRVVGFCMLVRREVVDRIGGLDPRYGRGNFEDDDYCVRSAIAGFEAAIAADCFIHHFGGTTFKAGAMDHQQMLFDNWEVFKQKWDLPAPVSYWHRLAFEMGPILSRPFDPALHVIPLAAGARDEQASFADLLLQYQTSVSAHQWEQAARIAREATTAFPREAFAWIMLAIVQRIEGRVAEAITSVQQSLSIDETPFALLEVVRLALLTDNREQALHVSTYATGRFPEMALHFDALWASDEQPEQLAVA